MFFKHQRGPIAFGRPAAAVKSRVIGWTADQARRPAAPRPGPGAYGLHVELRRR